MAHQKCLIWLPETPRAFKKAGWTEVPTVRPWRAANGNAPSVQTKHMFSLSFQIALNWRMSWRRSYYWRDHFCAESDISDGNLLSGEGELSCASGPCSGLSLALNYVCTDFSGEEDWSSGLGRGVYDLEPGADPWFSARYKENLRSIQSKTGAWNFLVTGVCLGFVHV